MFAVKHHPFHAVPQVIKRGEDDRKRPAFVMRQQSRNVFEQKINFYTRAGEEDGGAG